MTARLAILNGPNLNLLGVREPHIYGTTTLAAVEASCREFADFAGLTVAFHQSNHEGVLVDLVHDARDSADALIINPAGYSFTSIALLDALKTFGGPIIDSTYPTSMRGMNCIVIPYCLAQPRRSFAAWAHTAMSSPCRLPRRCWANSQTSCRR